MNSSILDRISERNKKYEQRLGFVKKQPIKEMTIREMLGSMRKLNEDQPRTISQSEIDREHEKMQNYFAEDGVNITFQDFAIRPDAVFMSGTIDNDIQFAYEVSQDHLKMEPGDLHYLNGFDSTDPENDKLVKKVQDYYNTFKQYWIDNELQLKGI